MSTVDTSTKELYLYYYRRAVPGIRLHKHLANLLPLDRSLFAFVLCFYDKKSSKNHKCGESVSIGVIDEVLSANDDPNTLLQINR